MNRKLPPNCVRGRIRQFIERHADKLGDEVLEVGSRITIKEAWWIVNRDLARGNWTGMDMQPGHGVDVVADLHELPQEWTGKFTGVLCSEVLEHVAEPWVALPEIRRVVRPGGFAIFTTLFAFPEHGFPDDYWRYTTSGLTRLLRSAGFTDVHAEYAGGIELMLDDHGEGPVNRRKLPMHTFAVARC